ncbi:MAG: hypothetical protein JSW45_02565 [Thiotrichales bacterium]|nr:MAG: hypothetical protein JSW45_02565 [Thiotrichales bacterium]
MKKVLLAIVLVLLIGVAAVLYYVFTNLDAIVKAAIEEFGSQAVRTSVQVDSVAIGLSEGSAAISGLTVANPDGFSLPHAFSLGEIAVDINLEKTTGDRVAIDAIRIAAPRVFYEINADRKGSLNVLKDNLGLGGASAGSGTGGSGSSAGDTSAPVSLDIARFEFKDASLHAKVVPLKDRTYDLQLPSLVLTDLQGTPEQIARQVLDRLIRHAEQEIRKRGIDQELAEIKAKAQQRIDEEKAKLKQQADDRIESEKQQLENKLLDRLR